MTNKNPNIRLFSLQPFLDPVCSFAFRHLLFSSEARFFEICDNGLQPRYDLLHTRQFTVVLEPVFLFSFSFSGAFLESRLFRLFFVYEVPPGCDRAKDG